MSEKTNEEQEPVPTGQKWFDNIWFLFLMSLIVSTLIYNVWGIIDLLGVPPAP